MDGLSSGAPDATGGATKPQVLKPQTGGFGGGWGSRSAVDDTGIATAVVATIHGVRHVVTESLWQSGELETALTAAALWQEAGVDDGDGAP